MSVCGVGNYVPYKHFVCRRDGKITREYSVWADMIARCYTDYYPTYANCTVSAEWHRSDVFWQWAENQIGFLKDYYLDKDLLVIGNKGYNKEVCVFIPRNLNQFLCAADAIRGEYPVGVYFDTARNKFGAKISINNKTVSLGRYISIEDAMSVYKEAKTNEGRRWADRLKSSEYVVDERVISAMETYIFSYPQEHRLDKIEADSYERCVEQLEAAKNGGKK